MKGGALDLILHSPGGSPEAAEVIVSYLRNRFDNIRVIVPHLAMSAAAMIVCAADQVILGKQSFLGPTGPQFVLDTPLGTRLVPACAILQQFKGIQREVAEDPAALPAWAPILGQYGDGLLARCEAASDLSRKLTREWLKNYMFKHRKNPLGQAQKASGWFVDQEKFKSHTKHIKRSDVEDMGLPVIRLEDDPKLQDLALSAFHTTSHAFVQSRVAKIVASQDGCVYVTGSGRAATPHGQVGMAPGTEAGVPHY